MHNEAILPKELIKEQIGKKEKQEAKKYLSRAMKCAEIIEYKQLQLKKLSDNITSPTSTGLSKLGVKIYTNANKYEDMITTKLFIEEQINKELVYLFDVAKEIQELIDSLRDPLYRTILTMRYLEAMKWEAIAECLCISMRHIYRLHDASLEKTAELLHGK